MQLLRLLLGWPFSLIWLCITNIRNFLYDWGVLRSTSFSIPVICVGNLAVGGTGKTPMINYLTGYFLSQGVSVAILSRGYGRTTRGFGFVEDTSTPATVGDEPLLFFRRWGEHVPVAVGENRVRGIRSLRERHPGLQVVLLDDGYQHRAVRPSVSILLTTYQNPFYKDFVMPAGSLRESRRWARRSSMVVMTKAPAELSEEKRAAIRRRLQPYMSPGGAAYFSSVSYGMPTSFGMEAAWLPRVFLVSGIANPGPLTDYLKQTGVEVVRHWEKADHFVYSTHEMELLVEEYEKLGECVILTTEKDFVKMINPAFSRYVRRAPFFYIPVEFSFSKEKENFEAELQRLIAINQ